MGQPMFGVCRAAACLCVDCDRVCFGYISFHATSVLIR
eukprot:XP_001704813.1 Hypothetical protein GL50803_38619 [Giardia lamblia ATCC 50803]